jgi:hypothetical protein
VSGGTESLVHSSKEFVGLITTLATILLLLLLLLVVVAAVAKMHCQS